MGSHDWSPTWTAPSEAQVDPDLVAGKDRTRAMRALTSSLRVSVPFAKIRIMLGSHGIEVDELGYVVSAVEAWKKHGIYPPPLIGDANDPIIVARVKKHRARIAELPAHEQERHFRGEREFMTGFLKGFESEATAPTAEDLQRSQEDQLQ
jgi:hypothetical protein